MTTAAEIAELDIEELDTRLVEGRKELFNLRFQLATGQLDNFSRISQVKKDVARLLTELRAREIAEAEGLALEEMPGHLAAARQRTEETLPPAGTSPTKRRPRRPSSWPRTRSRPRSTKPSSRRGPTTGTTGRTMTTTWRRRADDRRTGYRGAGEPPEGS